jgi:Family of unknown function (DUF5309)
MAAFPLARKDHPVPKVTNAYVTYNTLSNREDLSNAIYNIDPFDTPVMSAIRRRNVKNRIFDWQTEFLPLVNLANAQVEGFQLSNSLSTPTTRRNNTTQISERDATVSGSQEESDAAGKGSEMAHQMALAAKVLKSDIESILCSRQARNDGNDTGPTARTTEGFAHWLGRAVDKNSTVAAAVAPGTVTTSLPVAATDAFAAVAGGSQVSITEAMLGDAMQQAYVNGGSPTMWIVPPGPKRTISTFTGRSTTQVLVGRTEVVSTIDVIATDFGRVKVAPSRWLQPDVGLLIDPDYAAVAFFRAFRQFLMARVGDAETRMLVCEWGLEMRNPLAHILFNGIKK